MGVSYSYLGTSTAALPRSGTRATVCQSTQRNPDRAARAALTTHRVQGSGGAVEQGMGIVLTGRVSNSWRGHDDNEAGCTN